MVISDDVDGLFETYEKCPGKKDTLIFKEVDSRFNLDEQDEQDDDDEEEDGDEAEEAHQLTAERVGGNDSTRKVVEDFESRDTSNSPIPSVLARSSQRGRHPKSNQMKDFNYE